MTITWSPLWTGHPPSSVSSTATRTTPITGVSQRSSSSTTAGMIDGSSTMRCRCSGCWAR